MKEHDWRSTIDTNDNTMCINCGLSQHAVKTADDTACPGIQTAWLEKLFEQRTALRNQLDDLAGEVYKMQKNIERGRWGYAVTDAGRLFEKAREAIKKCLQEP